MARVTDRLSRRQERRLLKVGRRVFAEDFPNPERIGCPAADVLRAMALRRPSPAGSPHPIEHLTICSPCFREYSSYRKRAQMVKGARFALLAATVVLVLGTVLWLSVGRRKPEIVRQPDLPEFQLVTLDLRPFSSARGLPNPETPPLTIPRGRLRIKFLLPVGSEEGQYEVRWLASDGHEALLLRGEARIVAYTTALQTDADLRGLSPGRYRLQIGRPGSSSQTYWLNLE